MANEAAARFGGQRSRLGLGLALLVAALGVVAFVQAQKRVAAPLVSLALVLRFLLTGEGEQAATLSVVVKTLTLYTIMVTGCIWEKVVFGQYLFAPAFFWEDVFSMAVLALHTAYLLALFNGWLDARGLMWLALAAYATYVVNAGQFLYKLRMARLHGQSRLAPTGATA